MTQYSRSRQLNQFHAFYMIPSYQTQIFNPHLLYHISKKRIQSSELLLCQKNTYKIRKYLCASVEIQNFYIVSFSHYLLMLSLYVPHVLCLAGCYHWETWNNAFHFSHKQNNQRCKWSALNFQNSLIMPSFFSSFCHSLISCRFWFL